MRNFNFLILFVSFISCRQAIRFNEVCQQSNEIQYMKEDISVRLTPKVSLFNKVCDFLNNPENFKKVNPKSLRNTNSYRFDFFSNHQRIKTLTIYKPIDIYDIGYVLDDFGTDNDYLCNKANTETLLNDLGLILISLLMLRIYDKKDI